MKKNSSLESQKIRASKRKKSEMDVSLIPQVRRRPQLKVENEFKRSKNCKLHFANWCENGHQSNALEPIFDHQKSS